MEIASFDTHGEAVIEAQRRAARAVACWLVWRHFDGRWCAARLSDVEGRDWIGQDFVSVWP